MYSKNDYRYYLEHRLAESDDYLAHYGVKGMKWKHHLKKRINQKFNTYKGEYDTEYGYLSGAHNQKYAGIQSKKNPNRFLEVGKSKYKNGSKEYNVLIPHISKTNKRIEKRIGRVRISGGNYEDSDGISVSIDASSRKRYKKNNRRVAAKVATDATWAPGYLAKQAAENTKKKRRRVDW